MKLCKILFFSILLISVSIIAQHPVRGMKITFSDNKVSEEKKDLSVQDGSKEVSEDAYDKKSPTTWKSFFKQCGAVYGIYYLKSALFNIFDTSLTNDEYSIRSLFAHIPFVNKPSPAQRPDMGWWRRENNAAVADNRIGVYKKTQTMMSYLSSTGGLFAFIGAFSLQEKIAEQDRVETSIAAHALGALFAWLTPKPRFIIRKLYGRVSSQEKHDREHAEAMRQAQNAFDDYQQQENARRQRELQEQQRRAREESMRRERARIERETRERQRQEEMRQKREAERLRQERERVAREFAERRLREEENHRIYELNEPVRTHNARIVLKTIRLFNLPHEESEKIAQRINSFLPILNDCSICMDNEAPHRFVNTSCGHQFHKPCLRQWVLRKARGAETCPMCRKDLSRTALVLGFRGPPVIDRFSQNSDNAHQSRDEFQQSMARWSQEMEDRRQRRRQQAELAGRRMQDFMRSFRNNGDR